MQRILPHFARRLRSLRVPEDEAGRVAVAFSGGPDSTALVALTARWHQLGAISTPPPFALIVDHQLRADSTAEAHHAALVAQDLGLTPRVLTVDWGQAAPLPQHKMMAARAARYALLLEECQREGVHHLLTAHHADDQAETFLLRLIHASGVDGLACIAPENRAHVVSHGVRLLRPLLSAHKQELLSVCDEVGLPYAEDPSNEDASFQRNRLRQLLWNGHSEYDSAQESLDSPDDAPLDAESSWPDAYVPPIVHDILRLQRLCARVSSVQQRQAAQLLRRAALYAAACSSLNPIPRWQHPQQPDQYAEYSHRRRWIHWPSQLAALSHTLGDIPHAILQVRPFAAVDEVVAATAVAHLLQAVAHSDYPPGLPDCVKLARRLADGRLSGAFTGGGCTVQPLVRSKGRYMLVVQQRDQAAVLSLLRPPTPPSPPREEGRPLEGDRSDEEAQYARTRDEMMHAASG